MNSKVESDEECDFIGFAPTKEKTNEEVAEAIALAKQLHVYKPGIEFVPGSKLEVLDARDNKWYLCKVVEVDWGELDILVHYEKWSIRFDEWLKMDSTRIRPSKAGTREAKKFYYIKEKVLGYWAPDGKYYAGEILKHLSEDCWSVLFYDGFTKSLRSSHIRKLDSIEEEKPAELIEVKVEPKPEIVSLPPPVAEKPPKVEEPCASGSKTKNGIFDVKIIEEKRKSRRNPAVDKLFQSIRKRRRSEKDDDGEIYCKPKKGFKSGIKTLDVVNLDSTVLTTSSSESSADESFEEDTNGSNSDSSVSVDSSSTKASSKKLTLKNCKKQTFNETINIGALGSPYREEDPQLSTGSVLSPSTSTEDMGFKGFESASLSAEKYRLKETLSSMLGIPLPMDDHSCPKKGCGKSFRKQNLLRMHMKHYHPKLFRQDEGFMSGGSTPAPHIRSLADDFQDEKPIKREPKIEIKKLQLNPVKIEDIKPSFLTGPSTAPVKTTGSFFSSFKRKAAVGRHKLLRESSLRKVRKSAASECLSENDLQDFSSGLSRNCKRKGSGSVKIPQFPAELQDIPDSPDKADTIEKSDPDAIINCRCGFKEEDGLMLQCDICLCWQHGSCYHIESEEQVPNSYICSICENSRLQRPSMRFRHHQDWLKEGKLPRFSGSEGSTRLESMVRNCHELMGNVLSVSDVMHSLNLKLYIAKRDDHPKLVMWHKKWKDEEESDSNKLSNQTAQLETAGRDKHSGGVRDDRGLCSSSGGGDRHSADKLTAPHRIDSPAEQDCETDDVKPTIDDNEDSLSNASTSDLKVPVGKREVVKFDLTEHSSLEVLNEAVTKKEVPSDKEERKVGVATGSSETKNERYSDWKNPSVEMPLRDKIKMELEEERPQETSSLQPESKEPMNIESRTYSKEEPLPDDQKETIDEAFLFGLPGLGNEANVSADLTDLLSSNVELERFVHQASTELAPMDGQLAPVVQRAPIIPQAERILPVKCKLNLLDHIEKMQNRLFERFDLIEDNIQALESEMGLTSKFSKEEEEMLFNEASQGRDETTIQARALVRMSLRDLDTASKLISYRPS